MPLSNSERQILAQLELSFSGDSGRLARIERNARRRRTLTGVAAPLGLLAGLVLVAVGVGLSGGAGAVVAVAGYLLLVAAAQVGVIGLRGIRTARRAQRI